VGNVNQRYRAGAENGGAKRYGYGPVTYRLVSSTLPSPKGSTNEMERSADGLRLFCGQCGVNLAGTLAPEQLLSAPPTNYRR